MQIAYLSVNRYTRNLVDEGNGKFNLMLLCWGEGHSSAVHDHSDAHCFMKVNISKKFISILNSKERLCHFEDAGWKFARNPFLLAGTEH